MLRFDGHAKAAFVAACFTLILCGVGFGAAVKALNVYLKKEPVELRHELSIIPPPDQEEAVSGLSFFQSVSRVCLLRGKGP